MKAHELKLEYLPPLHNTCVAFGAFDAMHLGHRQVLKTLFAAKKAGQTAVLACIGMPTLTTPQQQTDWALAWGADLVLHLPTETQKLAPEELVQGVLIERLDAQTIVAGENCPIGTAHGGALLSQLCRQRGINAQICPVVMADGAPVSSYRVAQALASGTPQQAAVLLGRPYAIPGTVVHGKALGRTVGMPTANLSVSKQLVLPARGVYATHVWWQGKRYGGLTNIGTRPSVDDSTKVTIETLILDFDESLYGETLILEPVAFLRPVQKFDSLNQVQAQVQRDLEKARTIL